MGGSGMTLLSGIRVLDLSLQLPGPFCTMMMADYGADVVKIDEPSPRVRNPFAAEEPGTGPVDRYLNRGKWSATINLKAEEGKAIFLRLAGTADVIVEGFRPGVVSRLGIDYDTVSSVNPKIVYCSISGFGQDGPYRDRPGYDPVAQAMSGIMINTGEPEGPPVRVLPTMVDYLTGNHMAYAIALALMDREKTGKGQRIEIALLDGIHEALNSCFRIHSISPSLLMVNDTHTWAVVEMNASCETSSVPPAYCIGCLWAASISVAH